MKKITPCLWFDGKVEEAINFYTSLFKSSKVLDISYYGEGQPMPAGSVLVATFEIEGQEIMILNGGPSFKLTEAASLYINCETQEEIDFYWEKLTADGGEEGPCGWLKDKFGLSWQVAPSIILELINSKDKKKAGNVMAALMQMKKLDIKALKQAYEQ
ncbi:VOC family protein [Mucilaginibacter sabulilitoris]|uniref:VOC family protein n=1 Tax=Mucilaginibacter sabulilitoris TaxID=1173583 RepID=A0ABZ0TFK7_9SPHI|nr:VOC family protein [Mucilaginibacter sabulilitoris]WPU91207.1 VOC family protein [Mucilaginibacter sabulilitoris]